MKTTYWFARKFGNYRADFVNAVVVNRTGAERGGRRADRNAALPRAVANVALLHNAPPPRCCCRLPEKRGQCSRRGAYTRSSGVMSFCFLSFSLLFLFSSFPLLLVSFSFGGVLYALACALIFWRTGAPRRRVPSSGHFSAGGRRERLTVQKTCLPLRCQQ